MKQAPYIVIVILLFFLMLQRECHTCKKTECPENLVTINHYDTIKHVIKLQAPKVIDSVFIAVPANVDTLQILKQYFTTYYFSQDIQDTNILATIKDSVYSNKIIWRNFSYKLLKPVKIEIHTPVPQTDRLKLFAGFFTGGSLSGINSFGPQLTLITTKDHLYSAGFNIVDKSFHAGMSWKIKIR